MKTVKECVTLREYREEVLGLPQTEVGRRCKRHQAWVSFIERGHLPRAWNREPLLKAYELEADDFVRLVTSAAKSTVMRKPISEDMPLWCCATAEEKSQVLSLEASGRLGEAAQVLTHIYEREAKHA